MTMITMMFRIFPLQSGIVAIMSRQLIRHCRRPRILGAATPTGLFLAIVVVLAGLSSSMTATSDAEYIVEEKDW